MAMNRKRLAVIALLLVSVVSSSPAQQTPQEKKIKTGLTKEDWAYTLAPRVTAKEVTYYLSTIAGGVRATALSLKLNLQ